MGAHTADEDAEDIDMLDAAGSAGLDDEPGFGGGADEYDVGEPDETAPGADDDEGVDDSDAGSLGDDDDDDDGGAMGEELAAEAKKAVALLPSGTRTRLSEMLVSYSPEEFRIMSLAAVRPAPKNVH